MIGHGWTRMDADKIISALIQFFVGLDLGQRCDHSALVVVERAELLLDEMDWVTYERRREWRYRMRFLERVPLGTPYPDVAARVREVVRNEAIARRCTLVMDDGCDRRGGAGAGRSAARRTGVRGSRG